MLNSDEIISLYLSGHTVKEIQKIVGCSQTSVNNILRKNNIKLRKRIPHNKICFTQDEITEIISLYNSNHSLNYILDKFNIKNKDTIKQVLIANGVNLRKRTQKYTVDDSYFSSIDSPNKAYILGFIITDGTISYNRPNIQISLARVDRDHLINIKQELGYTGPINDSQVWLNGKCFQKSTLSITSPMLKNDLISLGITSNKSSTVKIPDINPKYYPDLLRGLFDGDGTVGQCANFSICGNKYVVQWVADYCEQLCGYKAELKKDKRRKDWYRYIYIGKKPSQIIFETMYKDATLYLSRKKDKYIERR